MASSSWLGSAWACGSPFSARMRSSIVGPTELAIRSRMPSINATTSIGRLCNSWRRANPRSRWTSVLARSLDCNALSSHRSVRGSCPLNLCCSMSSAPTIGVSRLLKSCATPPVSWPSVSSFCASWSCWTAARYSAVRSSTRLSRLAAKACNSSSRLRASYCRRRARRADRARLTSVVGWKGRSRKVTFPSVSK